MTEAAYGRQRRKCRHDNPGSDDNRDPADELKRLGGPELCGDIDIRIGRDGTWFYHGSPIGRKRLVKLFANVLRRDEAGDYWLVTPAEKARITVDDAPFTAVEMTVQGSGESQNLIFRTNIDEIVMAGPGHPIRVETNSGTGSPAPYLKVRDGLEALIVRSVFYDLVEVGTEADIEGRSVLGVWSDGAFFVIGPLDET